MPSDEPPDGAFQAALRAMMREGRERGYVTYDELNRLLPQDQVTSEQIEDVMAQLSEQGITLIESDVANVNRTEAATRWRASEDPLHMCPSEMESVEPLSREDEIAIAKGIEANRAKMIDGICESPLTVVALLSWATALAEGRMLLQDILDPAATEAAPLPQVLKTFARIDKVHGKLSRLQEKRLTLLRKGEKLPTRGESRYEKLKDELFQLIKVLRLNDARVEQLVEQLYHLNKQLIGFEGRLLRMAEKCGVDRGEFLKYYYGRELDLRWVSRVKRLSGKGWEKFAARHGDEVKDIRKEIAQISEDSGLPISEFRRIVTTVKTGEREATKAKRELVAANLRLVISIAKEFAVHGRPLPKLIEDGEAGLVKAVDRFDHRRGQSFSSFAEGWIRDAVGRARAE